MHKKFGWKDIAMKKQITSIQWKKKILMWSFAETFVLENTLKPESLFLK